MNQIFGPILRADDFVNKILFEFFFVKFHQNTNKKKKKQKQYYILKLGINLKKK